MAVTPTYNEIALYCPAWVQPATPQSPANDPAVPLTFGTFSAGLGQTGSSLKLNQNSIRAEILAQHGGAGAHGVFYGLDLSVSSGLLLAYSAGGANVNGPQVKSAGTLALTANVYNWVWITSAGTVTAVTGTDRKTVTAAPTSACAFLGRVLCGASTIVEIDYSGRHYLRGGGLWRRTADLGEPTDTPSATALFMTRGVDGVWFWDGTDYLSVGGDTSALTDTTDELQAQLDELGYAFRALLRQYVLLLGDLPQNAILASEFERALGEG